MTSERILVETVNLCKSYGNVTAVDNLNLEVPEGTIFGLLGPNGAGKTTTILMLLGLTEPTSGQALIGGHDSARAPLAVKSMVGYLPDNVGFYNEMTGRENLRYSADLNGLSRSESSARINEALKRVKLSKDADRKVREYSRGMRQRLGIADVLIKEPRLIIMDEPTLGIDPEGVRELLDIITSLARRDGRTVLISSHLLHQVQQICDQVGLFVDGKLIAKGSVAELGQQLLQETTLKIELQAEPGGPELRRLCSAIEGVRTIEDAGDRLVLECRSDVRPQLVRNIMGEGYELLHMHLRGVTLDDIYRRYFRKEG